MTRDPPERDDLIDMTYGDYWDELAQARDEGRKEGRSAEIQLAQETDQRAHAGAVIGFGAVTIAIAVITWMLGSLTELLAGVYLLGALTLYLAQSLGPITYQLLTRRAR